MSDLKYSKVTLLDLLELSVGETTEDGRFELMHTEQVGKRRWSADHISVYKDNQKGIFFQTHWSRGSTEQQDERPYEFENNEIDCTRVWPKQVVKTIYTSENPGG